MSKREFKGFGDYVEIFRGGAQVDSNGKNHDGDAMIDRAISSFQAAVHQPPLVVGHPKDNEPAYGWVKDLRTATTNGVKTLLAKFEDVVPEFEDLVRQGRYKKRSASFYPDGRLRHVGFLGAVPPAVKGLADLKFDDGDKELLTFDFVDLQTGVLVRFMNRMREFLIEKEGMDTADRVVPGWDVDMLKAEGVREEMENPVLYSENKPKEDTMGDQDKNFTEADIEAAKAKAKAEAKAEMTAEFAEKELVQKKDADKGAIKAFCDQGVAKGALLPAWIDGGLQNFMEGLAGQEAVSFAEGSTQTPLDWFMDFMEKLPPAVTLEEIAKRDGKQVDNNDADDIARRARDFQDSESKAGRTICISDAVASVTR